MAPPSPPVTVLTGWKLKQVISARLPHRLALIFRADGMRGILDQDQIVLLTDLPDLIQLHCLTGEIYRNDRFRPGCDQLADGRRIDIVGLRINICENRLRTRI